MNHFDPTTDVDLELRLRKIAREPRPEMPEAVYAYVGRVVRGEAESPSGVELSPLNRPLLRWPRFAAASGIAATLVLALAATVLLSVNRPVVSSTPSSPGLPDSWSALQWHDITATAFKSSDKSWLHGQSVLSWHGRDFANSEGSLWTSSDGQAWESVSGGPDLFRLLATSHWLVGAGFVDSVQPCTQGGGLTCTTRYAIWYSTDGVAWREASLTSAGPLYGVLTGMAASGTNAIVLVDQNLDPSAEPSDVYASSDGANWQKASLPADMARAVSPEISSTRTGFLVNGFVPDPSGSSKIEGADGSMVMGSWRSWTSADGLDWASYDVAAAGLPAIFTVVSGLLGDDTPPGHFHSSDDLKWAKDETVPCRGGNVYMSSNGTEIIRQGDGPDFCVSLGDGRWQHLANVGGVASLPAGGRSWAVPGGVIYAVGSQVYFGKALTGAVLDPTLPPGGTLPPTPDGTVPIVGPAPTPSPS